MSGFRFGFVLHVWNRMRTEEVRSRPGEARRQGLAWTGSPFVRVALVPQNEALLFMPPLVRSATWACRAVWVLVGATHGPRTAQSHVVRSEWIRVRPDVHEPPRFDRPAYCANVSFPAERPGSRVRWCCPGSPCVRAAG